MSENGNPDLIKRYAGSRLYDTTTLSYVTLDDLSEMIVRHRRFVVRDAATGDDVTPDILKLLH
ncbi:MAG: polyhydroxyalkanoate synthesis regulator DNA-binding domain-containing protein [Pseudomonadota bacterium]